MKHKFKPLIGMWSVILMAGMLSGCGSTQEYAIQRSQRLLALYPVGVTTRSAVSARWGGDSGMKTAQRPSGGWNKHPTEEVARRCLASESRTGRRVQSYECRFGPDGLFSLCYCWFYYDRQDRLVDAEWQWSSD